jgi:ABC-type dipeptide/oligopeptide/nickel transport system permease subunit
MMPPNAELTSMHAKHPHRARWWIAIPPLLLVALAILTVVLTRN